MHLSNDSRIFTRDAAAAGLLTLVLIATAATHATAHDGSASGPSLLEQLKDPATEIRVAQFWPFGGQQQRQEPQAPAPSRSGSSRYYYVQSRDIFGNPGPTYRVLGVEKPKKKKVAADRHKARTAELLRKASPPPPTNGPLLLVVSLGKQQVTLYDQGVPVVTSPISSGNPNFPTPTGVFSVIQKQWFHRSNLYSAAPMPFMQRLTWSGVALHAGELPGYPASHGCIRLPEEFALRLWGTTKVGARVIISYGEVKPVAIAHPRLFNPKPQKPKDDAPDTPMASRRPAPSAALAVPELQPIALQGQLSVASVPLTVTALDRAAAGEGLNFLAGLYNKLTLVNSDGTPIADDVDALDENDDVVAANGRSPATVSIVRPGRANEVLEVTEAPQINEDGVARITVMRGSRPAEIEVIAVTKVAPAPQLALPLPEATPQLALPVLTPAPQLPQQETETPVVVANTGTVIAAKARRERQTQGETPAKPPAPQARPLRPGPISVFVSRKERRLFVRKGFEPLFDTPVTIVEPDKLLGTHVFTAIAVTETEARWNVVSLPVERVKGQMVVAAEGRGSHKRARRTQEVVSGPPPVTATEALDRIEMPGDAVNRISELLSAGATLTVSDQGLGHETGRETDFTVVLTK